MVNFIQKYINYFKTFNNFYYLLSLLVKRDIKKKYKGSFLGILWSLLNPLLQVVLLTLIFSSLFNTTVNNFALYAITGKLVFDYFSSASSISMYSIIESADLLKKIYLPKYIMVISKVLSNYVIFLISLADLILVMIITNAKFTIHLIYVPIYLVLLLVFTCGVSLILATVATFFRDIIHLYSVFIMMLMFASAIFYPSEIIPDKYQFVLQLNPIYYFIDGFRRIICMGISPSINSLITCLIISSASFFIGVIIFEKNQNKFMSYI